MSRDDGLRLADTCMMDEPKMPDAELLDRVVASDN